MTHRKYFELFCDIDDFPAVNRLLQKKLYNRCDPSDPIWEKEKIYEEILDEEIDPYEWKWANTPHADKGSIPRDFFNTHAYVPKVKRARGGVKFA